MGVGCREVCISCVYPARADQGRLPHSCRLAAWALSLQEPAELCLLFPRPHWQSVHLSIRRRSLPLVTIAAEIAFCQQHYVAGAHRVILLTNTVRLCEIELTLTLSRP